MLKVQQSISAHPPAIIFSIKFESDFKKDLKINVVKAIDDPIISVGAIALLISFDMLICILFFNAMQ